jgi:iron complex transport system ATP-binding protein
VLPQDSTLSAEFTVMEVALLGRTPHSPLRPSVQDREIALAALAATDSLHLVSQRYTTLSGGERQRVHLARVLAQVWEGADEPRYLLLDEPTSSLDPAHQQIVLRAVRRFTEGGGGALAILHDLNLAAQYADEIVLLKHGRVVDCGSPAEVLTPDMIRATFDIVTVVLPHPTWDCPLIVHAMAHEDAERSKVM